MKAYAILDGGGVKGAALVGCLKAAELHGVTFAGYGGTSAGAIVALLAAVGYTPLELEHIVVNEVAFSSFLDDGGDSLIALQQWGEAFAKPATYWDWKISTLLAGRKWYHRINDGHGLYQATNLQNFLLNKLRQKVPAWAGQNDVTFADLEAAKCQKLKIVASDVRRCRPVTFSVAGHKDGSVIDAVRASMSYPFVFRPVSMGHSRLVDGGISSNLPVHLFAQESRRDGLPVVAFDLAASPAPMEEGYPFLSFVSDMVSTAIEAGDEVLRSVVDGVYHIRVATPPHIRTLDFKITPAQRRELFVTGQAAAAEFFTTRVPHWIGAQHTIDALRALHGRAELFEYLLNVLAREVAMLSETADVRTNIMLATQHETRIIVYQSGMDGDADVDLELAIHGGASGRAWLDRDLVVADLVAAAADPQSWNLTQPQQNKIRPDRQAVMSAPIFRRPSLGTVSEDVESYAVLGTLSVDTSTPLADSNWQEDEDLHTAFQAWADVFGKLLTN